MYSTNQTSKELLPILEGVSTQNKPLLIIAEDIDGEALATLIVNKMRGTIRVAAVKAPDFGDRRKLILEDIAILTGGQVFSTDKGMKLDKFSWDWKSLRKEVVNYGVRNSLLVAPMPTASTAQILGNNEAFEPFTTNLYLRRTLGGEFVVINKHLVNDLLKIGMWSDSIKNKLIFENGSVQNIPEIPTELKEIYKTVWEMSQKRILQMAANRSVFIDQSQSLNLFIDNVTKPKLLAAHIYGWKLGLKTGMYYLRTRAAVDAIKTLGVDISATQKIEGSITQTTQAPTAPTNSIHFEQNETALSMKPSDSPFECEGCGS